MVVASIDNISLIQKRELCIIIGNRNSVKLLELFTIDNK